MRTAKYQVNSLRSFIRSSVAARNLSFRGSPSDSNARELSKASGFQLPRLVLLPTSLHSHCLQTNSVSDKKDAKSGVSHVQNHVLRGGLSMISFQPQKGLDKEKHFNISSGLPRQIISKSIKHVCHITSNVRVAPLTKEHGFSWAEVPP